MRVQVRERRLPQARDRPRRSGGTGRQMTGIPAKADGSTTVLQASGSGAAPAQRGAISSHGDARSRRGGQARSTPLTQEQADLFQQNLLLWMDSGDICVPGYSRLSDNPEIQTACLRIAELVATMTIHVLENTEDGDIRIEDELSRMLDITPNRTMNRSQWLIVNVMNMLLYGKGNAICVPHTRDGLLESMEPISPSI